MRLGGNFPFPFTAPALNGAGEAIALLSGGMFIVPQGNWLVIPGQETVLEFFDPISGLWRGTQCYQGQVEQISSDGSNYRLVNLSGVVVGANITNAGSGGTNGIGPLQTGSTVSFAAPAAGGAPATAQGYVIVGGTVPAPTVTQGGSGFIAPPVIFCDPPPAGGIQATFTATISAAGVITGVTQVNPGAGYASIPNFYIVPQPQFYQGSVRWPGVPGSSDSPTAQGLSATGQPPGLINPANAWPGFPYQGNLTPPQSTLGALLTGNALTGSGTLTGIVVIAYGQGYTGAGSAVTFGGTSLGAAAATSIMSLCSLTATGSTLTPTTGGTGYIVGAPAETTLGLVSSFNNNNLFTPRPIRGKITAATGAFSVEDPGFGIQSGTGVGVGGGSITTLAVLGSAQLGGITDTSVLQYLGASG